MSKQFPDSKPFTASEPCPGTEIPRSAPAALLLSLFWNHYFKYDFSLILERIEFDGIYTCLGYRYDLKLTKRKNFAKVVFF